jgi:hypothetical protein
MASCKLPTAEKAMSDLTPMDRRAAMFAREGTSWGAISWCRPCRLRNATGTSFPLVEQVWWRIVIGEDGVPHGVETERHATWVKLGSSLRPVPPMTAMWTGSDRGHI